LPGNEESLRFSDERYKDKEQARRWNNVLKFAKSQWHDDKVKIYIVQSLKELAETFPVDTSELSGLLKEFGYAFAATWQPYKLIELLTYAHNCTRFRSTTAILRKRSGSSLADHRPKRTSTWFAPASRA
jgi:hypothetical protein